MPTSEKELVSCISIVSPLSQDLQQLGGGIRQCLHLAASAVDPLWASSELGSRGWLVRDIGHRPLSRQASPKERTSVTRWVHSCLDLSL